MEDTNGKLNIAREADGAPVTLEVRRSIGFDKGKLRTASITVGPMVVRGLRSQASRLRALHDYDRQPTLYEDACAAAVERGSPELVEGLRRMLELGRPALLTIYGLQLDDTPVATPVDGVFNQSHVPIETAVHIGIAKILGIRGVAFAHENDGRIVRAVCPVRRFADTASSQGANADLQSHTDNGHLCIPHSNDTHPYRLPAANAFQSFATVKAFDPVPMRVRLFDDILDNLDPQGGDVRELEQFTDLQRAEFAFCSPPSHGEVHRLEPLPVIVKLDDPALGYGLRFHGGTMVGTTPRAKAALELLRFAIARTSEQVIVTRRGDVILYDNRRVIHRREPYEAKFDGTDRYYIRAYGQPSEDVERWENALGGNGRVV